MNHNLNFINRRIRNKFKAQTVSYSLRPIEHISADLLPDNLENIIFKILFFAPNYGMKQSFLLI